VPGTVVKRRWKLVLGAAGLALCAGGMVGAWLLDRTVLAKMAERDGHDALRSGDPGLAEERFSAAIRKFPAGGKESARAHAARGISRLRLGKADEALDDLDTALRQDPGHQVGRAYRGAALYKQGRYLEAKEELTRSLNADPKSVVSLYYLGLVAERGGDFDEAYWHFTEAVRTNPGFAQGFAALSRVFKAKGDLLGEETYARLAKEKDPNVQMEIE
jgi:tetratricopeptide (TPR) repeat protein